MKSNILLISSVLAALAALALVSINSVAAGLLFVAAGTLAIFVSDYGRAIRPLTVQAEIVPFNPKDCTRDFRSLAA